MGLNQNKIEFDPLSADPGSPIDGSVWFNTTDSVFRSRIGGETRLISQNTHVIDLRDGATATSTSSTTEPTQFGQSGMLLQRFRSISVDTIKNGSTIRAMDLFGSATFKNSGGGNTSNLKIGIRFEGSTTVRFSAAQSVVGTTAVTKFYSLDLLPFLADFTNGNLFGAFGVWSDAGTTTVGSGSTTEPNPSLLMRVITA